MIAALIVCTILTMLTTMSITPVSGDVIGAVVIPHGDYALDPSIIDNVNGSLEIHRAALQVGELITQLQPDLIFLSSPHAIAIDRDFGIFLNTNASGYALIGQDLHNSSFPSYKVPLSISLAADEASSLLARLKTRYGMNVSGITGFGDGDDMPLRWGEVIPLWFFMQQHQQQSASSMAHAMRTLIMSQPTRRSTEGSSAAMLAELHHMGELIMAYLDSLPQRVMIIVSSDLAHTHRADGPYGYSPAAQPFDDAVGQWASTLDDTYLIKRAASLLDDAKSCGFTGLVMLNGMLQSTYKQYEWQASMLVNRWPTYYGMMVATFLPRPQQ